VRAGSFGEVHLLRGEDYAKLEELIKVVPNLADNYKLNLVKNILVQLEGADPTTSEFATAFEETSEQTLRDIAAASRLVQYRKARN